MSTVENEIVVKLKIDTTAFDEQLARLKAQIKEVLPQHKWKGRMFTSRTVYPQSRNWYHTVMNEPDQNGQVFVEHRSKHEQGAVTYQLRPVKPGARDDDGVVYSDEYLYPNDYMEITEPPEWA